MRGGLRRHLQRTGTAPVALVIDQFEELFTLCRDAFEAEAFVENLLEASEVNQARLIIALRADFYAHCAQHPRLREALGDHQEYVGPMTAAELRRAIEVPAAQGGWELETGLVELLLRDVGEEPGALPLLSHALLETLRRREARRLTLAGYSASGEVRGAIAQSAERVFAALSSDEQQATRRIFIALTELGEGMPDTRRRASIDALGASQSGALAAGRGAAGYARRQNRRSCARSSHSRVAATSRMVGPGSRRAAPAPPTWGGRRRLGTRGARS